MACIAHFLFIYIIINHLFFIYSFIYYCLFICYLLIYLLLLFYHSLKYLFIYLIWCFYREIHQWMRKSLKFVGLWEGKKLFWALLEITFRGCLVRWNREWKWIFCFHSYFLVDRNEFDDSISSIWMNLGMQDWNDYLFPFQCLIIIGMEMKKK